MSAFIETGNFDLLNPNNTIHEEELLSDDMERQCSISSSESVDLHGQYVSNDILVALLDRPSEMRGLAARNNQFYEALQYYIIETQGETSWKKFENLLYKTREQLPDRVWMNKISQFLTHNPIFLSKFKETVGWEEESDRSYMSPPPLTSHHNHHRRQSQGSNDRRRSRRLSSMSLGDVLEREDDILYEEAPAIPDGMFSSEHQFYQQPTSRRHSSSHHLVQSEPHPTFIDGAIDELEETKVIDNFSEDEQSDHLEDLLEDDDESDEEEQNVPDISKSLHHCHHRQSEVRIRETTHLLKLRDDPYFQSHLADTHKAFFRKAKQLLSISPSSSHFIATNRRNSILAGGIPGSPITELDEPRFQTCSDEETSHGDLTELVCCTRQKQPDDDMWLEQVLDALGDWPELIDSLHDIVDESTEINNSNNKCL